MIIPTVSATLGALPPQQPETRRILTRDI